jgi:hypothetical protein
MGNLLTRSAPSFVIMGHGVEAVTQPFEERFRLPPGYSLVTLAECGVMTHDRNVLPMLAAMQDPQYLRLFQDPVLGKQAIERITGQQLHVYTPGMRIPRFTMSLFTTWKLGKEDARQLMMSGIFSLPLKRTDIRKEDLQTFREFKIGTTFFATPGQVESAFAKSMFPPKATIDAVLQAASSKRTPQGLTAFNGDLLTRQLTFSFEDLLRTGTLPPGTYYYVICRSPEKSYDLIQQAEALQGFISKETLRIWFTDLCGEEPPASLFVYSGDRIEAQHEELDAYQRRCEAPGGVALDRYRARVEALLPKKESWITDEIQKILSGIDAIRVIPAVRRASLEQQRRR